MEQSVEEKLKALSSLNQKRIFLIDSDQKTKETYTRRKEINLQPTFPAYVL